MPSRASGLFARGLLALLFISTLVFACIYWRIYGAAKLFGDFDVFYRTARALVTHNLRAIYDIDGLKSLVASHGLKDFPYYMNPPTGLFVLYPFGLLPPLPALVLWNALQFALLYLVLRMDYTQRLFASLTPEGIPAPFLLGITFFAFSLQNFLFGQVALFCTVLFMLVLAWRNTHPVLAGIMLGLFSLKPQLGLLLPVLLVAERNWKPLFWALATAAALALCSLAIWGPGLWQDYAAMMGLRSQYLAQNPELLFTISTSIYAALRQLGASAEMGLLGQGVASLMVLMMLWPTLRKDEEFHKVLMLTLAAYLVSPYSLLYDIPLLALAASLWLRRAEADKATVSELIAMLLLLALPLVAVLLQLKHIPYSVIAISAALGVARLSTRNASE